MIIYNNLGSCDTVEAILASIEPAVPVPVPALGLYAVAMLVLLMLLGGLVGVRRVV